MAAGEYTSLHLTARLTYSATTVGRPHLRYFSRRSVGVNWHGNDLTLLTEKSVGVPVAKSSVVDLCVKCWTCVSREVCQSILMSHRCP